MNVGLVKSAIRLAGVLLLVGALLLFALPTGLAAFETTLLIVVAIALIVVGSSGVPTTPPTPPAPPVVQPALTAANSVVEETRFDLPAAVGASASYARADHTHGSPPSPRLAGDATGLLSSSLVVGLRGVPVSATPPTANQALVFNGQQWEPRTLV